MSSLLANIIGGSAFGFGVRCFQLGLQKRGMFECELIPCRNAVSPFCLSSFLSLFLSLFLSSLLSLSFRLVVPALPRLDPTIVCPFFIFLYGPRLSVYYPDSVVWVTVLENGSWAICQTGRMEVGMNCDVHCLFARVSVYSKDAPGVLILDSSTVGDRLVTVRLVWSKGWLVYWQSMMIFVLSNIVPLTHVAYAGAFGLAGYGIYEGEKRQWVLMI